MKFIWHLFRVIHRNPMLQKIQQCMYPYLKMDLWITLFISNDSFRSKRHLYTFTLKARGIIPRHCAEGSGWTDSLFSLISAIVFFIINQEVP